MPFAQIERQWLAAIMPAFIDPAGDLAVHDGEVDYVTAAERMAEGANWRARLGFHAAILLTTLAPVWMFARPQILSELSPGERTMVLSKMLVHPMFVVRGPATLLKLATTLALMHSREVRARTHYDHNPRRALPVVQHIEGAH
jgi:hypothetical protein